MSLRRLLPLLCLLLVPALGPVAPAHARGLTTAGRIEVEIQRVRARYGLPAFRPSSSLRRSASTYAAFLMRTGQFGHASRIYMSQSFRRRGEALALRFHGRRRARQVVDDWLRSPSHRRIVLGPSYRWMGIGGALGRFHGSPATIWVLHAGGR